MSPKLILSVVARAEGEILRVTLVHIFSFFEVSKTKSIFPTRSKAEHHHHTQILLENLRLKNVSVHGPESVLSFKRLRKIRFSHYRIRESSEAL